LDSEFLKRLTGTDPIRVRSLYSTKSIQYKPKFTIFMACNDIPSDNAVGDAIMRRMEILDFKKKYVENPTLPHERKIDLELNSRFSEERYYIAFMHYLICIAQRLFDKEDKIVPPASVLAAAEEYAEESNDIKTFINDNYALDCDKKYYISSKDLYDEYRMSCGRQDVIGKRKFMTELRTIAEYGNKVVGGRRKRGFFGIRKLSEVEAEFQEAAEAEEAPKSGFFSFSRT
jgi:phage/plasmid-associated DNA primase